MVALKPDFLVIMYSINLPRIVHGPRSMNDNNYNIWVILWGNIGLLYNYKMHIEISMVNNFCWQLGRDRIEISLIVCNIYVYDTLSHWCIRHHNHLLLWA